MDYALAIRRNADQLKDIVLALFTFARMRVGGSLFTLPRSTLAAIMLVLRPAESAVRRLILIAAQSLGASIASHSASSPAELARLANLPTCGGDVSEADRGGCTFQLFDPLKSFDPEARLDTISFVIVTADDRTALVQAPDNTPVNAAHIGHRLNALIRALNNIPYQARRLKRWQAKRDALLKAHQPTRFSPIRPGLPPGWHQRRRHEVDDVLRECHRMTNDFLNSS